ncbi:phosphatidylinositol-glycan biosynthesis class X protein isoform X2 [Danio rerio]|uniref:Phosphatidylinositol-glycan biosynthesis class X protein isoform X2 n=1 Tax=Danio rerio TaxID=7955 RepID=A0AC58IEY5_DANRE
MGTQREFSATLIGALHQKDVIGHGSKHLELGLEHERGSMMVYLYLLATVLCFIHHGNAQEADDCFPTEWLKSLVISVNISKAGFHRDLEYSVYWSETDHDVKALLVQKMPSGVYMDEYQLETLRHDTGLEVLLDSKVDLEAPEYLSSGFTALVFLSGNAVTVPVHGRYHRPSDTHSHVTVDIQPPRLLLRSDQCETPNAQHTVVEAPCTFRNESFCLWLEIQDLKGSAGVSLELPVGDSSKTTCVCVVTLLTTTLCCVYLLIVIWRHGTF